MNKELVPLKHPKPKNFQYDKVIFDNDEIAMIFGNYKKDPNKSLGMRWITAESKLGYPNIRGCGMWMVVPDKIAFYILEGIKNDPDEAKSIIDNSSFNSSRIELKNRLYPQKPLK
jgi:hypothetical protein